MIASGNNNDCPDCPKTSTSSNSSNGNIVPAMTSSDPIMDALKANYVDYVVNKVSSGEDRDDDGLIDAVTSPLFSAAEGAVGLMAYHLGSKVSSPYYGKGRISTPIGVRGFGGSHAFNAKAIEGLKVLHYGGVTMSMVGLLGSGYNTFVSKEQSRGLFLGDVIATRVGFMGLPGLAVYGIYHSNKWLYT